MYDPDLRRTPPRTPQCRAEAPERPRRKLRKRPLAVPVGWLAPGCGSVPEKGRTGFLPGAGLRPVLPLGAGLRPTNIHNCGTQGKAPLRELIRGLFLRQSAPLCSGRAFVGMPASPGAGLHPTAPPLSTQSIIALPFLLSSAGLRPVQCGSASVVDTECHRNRPAVEGGASAGIGERAARGPGKSGCWIGRGPALGCERAAMLEARPAIPDSADSLFPRGRNR